MFLSKILQKTNISHTLNPQIRTHTCVCRAVRNASFSEKFAYVLKDGQKPNE